MSVDSSFSIVGLILIALVACGLLAIAIRKPVILLWGVGFLMVMLLFGRFAVSPRVVLAPPTNAIAQAGDAWAVAESAGTGSAVPVRLAWAPILLLMILGALVVLGVQSVNRSRNGADAEPWHPEGRRGSWGVALAALAVVLLLGVVATKFYFRAESQRQSRHVASILSPMPQVVLSEQKHGVDPVIDDFDKPRIKIDAPAEMRPPGEQPLPAEAVIETPAQADDEDQAASVQEKSVEAKTATGAMGSASSADAAATDPPERSVFIQFDAAKLRRYRLVFDQVRDTLSRKDAFDGAEHVNSESNRLQITVIGRLENLARLPSLLLGATEGRPVYLRDVATISQEQLEPAAVGGPRPAWVDERPQRFGDTLRQVVVTDDYVTAAECHEVAKQLVTLAVWDHLQAQVGRDRSPATPFDLSDDGGFSADQQGKYENARDQLSRMGVPYGYIRAKIVKGEYVEEVDRMVGKMRRMHTLLEFTPEVDRYLTHSWTQSEKNWRVEVVGWFGALALSLVGLAYGLLKVDTWTKGYYSKRLFVGVPALFLGLVYLVLLANH